MYQIENRQNAFAMMNRAGELDDELLEQMSKNYLQGKRIGGLGSSAGGGALADQLSRADV